MPKTLNPPHDASLKRLAELAENLRDAWARREVRPCVDATGASTHAQVLDLTKEQAQLAIAGEWGFCNLGEVKRYFALDTQARATVVAVSTGDLETLRSLLRQNPSLVEVRSHKPWPLLGHAAHSFAGREGEELPNCVEMTEALLDAGAEVDADNGRALLTAASWPHVGVAEALIAGGAAVDGADSIGNPIFRVAFRLCRGRQAVCEPRGQG